MDKLRKNPVHKKL